MINNPILAFIEYYKIKVKAFGHGKEAWITFKAVVVHEAMNIAKERCALNENIFYPMEEHLHEISHQEYVQSLDKSGNR